MVRYLLQICFKFLQAGFDFTFFSRVVLTYLPHQSHHQYVEVTAWRGGGLRSLRWVWKGWSSLCERRGHHLGWATVVQSPRWVSSVSETESQCRSLSERPAPLLCHIHVELCGSNRPSFWSPQVGVWPHHPMTLKFAPFFLLGQFYPGNFFLP